MLSAINSVKFASANSYKRTYTNTNQNINQNAVGYQQSFGASRLARVVLTAMSLCSNLVTPAFAESGSEQAGKAIAGVTAKAVKKAGKKIKVEPVADEICARCDSPPNPDCIVDVPEKFLAPGGDIIKARINKVALEAFKKFRAVVKTEFGDDIAIRSALQDDEYFGAVTKEMYRRADEGGTLFLVDGLESHKSGCAFDYTMAKLHEGLLTDVVHDGITSLAEETAGKLNLKAVQVGDLNQHLELIPQR